MTDCALVLYSTPPPCLGGWIRHLGQNHYREQRLRDVCPVIDFVVFFEIASGDSAGETGDRCFTVRGKVITSDTEA